MVASARSVGDRAQRVTWNTRMIATQETVEAAGSTVGTATMEPTLELDLHARRRRASKAPTPVWTSADPNGKPRTLGGLTIIIPAYNEAKFVADTIKSVQNQTVHVDQIIVVDDCSTDGTGDVARACGNDIVVIRPPKNCGSKASALNFALEYVSSEFTLAIDADTTISPDGVEKLMVHFENANTGCVCGMVIPRRVQSLWERGRYVEYLYAFTMYKPIQDYYGRPMIASGCFSAYRTDLLRLLGGWSMRTVGEDMDLTWSMYKLGWDIRFVEEAVCYPVEPHNWNFLSKQLKRWTAGFAQCIRVHWRDLMHQPMMRSLVAVALWDALAAIIGMFVLLPALAIFVHPLFLLGYVLDVPSVAVPVLVAARKRGEVKKALACLPAFYLMRFVNCWFVLTSFWNEFVSKRRVTVFEKGH